MERNCVRRWCPFRCQMGLLQEDPPYSDSLHLTRRRLNIEFRNPFPNPHPDLQYHENVEPHIIFYTCGGNWSNSRLHKSITSHVRFLCLRKKVYNVQRTNVKEKVSDYEGKKE